MSRPKVSVVVAVYNTGPDLLRLVRSLDVQSMPREEFEVVLVDDGSTDDTPALLREVARQRSNVVVLTIENSGWPGRPRNVGLEHARGEYVFFSDHDDELYPHALDRMHGTARANGSDVVYGRIVRSGRPTPYWPLAAADVGRAELRGDVLLSRTVHKLFRKDFLTEHSIRFLEGKVRLEDHHFMAQVLPRAPVVSVVASEPCYRWVHRSDGTNSSDQPVEPAAYWGWYVRQLEVFAELAGPGTLLDDARVAVVTQAFSRFAPRGYLQGDGDQRQAVFDAVRPVVEHLPPRLDDRLPALKRLRVQALRDGDRERFDALQQRRTTIRFGQRLTQVRWDDGRLVVSARAELLDEHDQPLRLEHRDGALLLPLPDPLTSDDDGRRLLDGEAGTLEITVRDRDSGLEWPVRSEQRTSVEPDDGTAATAVTCTATIDPVSAAFGAALAPGVWEVVTRVQFLGENLVRRLDLEPDVTLPDDAEAPTGARVYATESGHLRLHLLPAAVGRPMVRSLGWDGDRLAVDLAPAPPEGAVLVARRRDGEADAAPCGAAALRDGAATVALPATSPGQIVDLSVALPVGGDVRVGYDGPDDPSRVPWRVYATARQSLSIKHEPEQAPPKAAARRLRAGLARLRDRGR